MEDTTYSEIGLDLGVMYLPSGDNLYFITKNSTEKSIYMQSDLFDGNIRFIKANPCNVGIIHGNNNVEQTGYYGVNGTFFWWDDNGVPYPTSILKVKNKIIRNEANHLPYHQSVLCFYFDGTFGIEKVYYATEISKPVLWAIGGIGLLGGHGYDPHWEGFKDAYADVLSKTNHTSIGITEDNKIILARSYYVYRKDTVNHMKALGCKYAIGLDSGNSCQIVTPDWKRPSWTARKVSNMIVVTDL